MDERNVIYGLESKEQGETKEVKMNLPIQHLVKLHGLKILTGTTISSTVTKALEQYFVQLDQEKAAARAARADNLEGQSEAPAVA